MFTINAIKIAYSIHSYIEFAGARAVFPLQFAVPPVYHLQTHPGVCVSNLLIIF